MITSGLHRIVAYKIAFDVVGSNDEEIDVLAKSLMNKAVTKRLFKRLEPNLRAYFIKEKLEAIEVLVKEMNNVKAGSKNRIDAADKLLTHLKTPENEETTNSLDEYQASIEKALRQMAKVQKERLESGHDIDSVQEIKVIDVDTDS